MSKETLTELGFLALTVVTLVIATYILVPGADDRIASFMRSFGSLAGAATGVFGAYMIAAWRFHHERDEERKVVAYAFGVSFVSLLDLLQDRINSFRNPYEDTYFESIEQFKEPGTFNLREGKFREDDIDIIVYFNSDKINEMIKSYNKCMDGIRDHPALQDWNSKITILNPKEYAVAFRAISYVNEVIGALQNERMGIHDVHAALLKTAKRIQQLGEDRNYLIRYIEATSDERLPRPMRKWRL